MSNIDWTKLVTREMKLAAQAAIKRAENVAIEDQWRILEVAFIADQLIGIEDGDPSALPGTDAQWRAYRTKVRAWKEGALYFPDITHRPIRPS